MNVSVKMSDLLQAVMAIDLDPIKVKLMHVESGEGWSVARTNAVEKEYRRFLCLMKLYPEEDTAPLVDVDTFWHYHILDTMKYAADCDQAFGYFLHHYPYVGLRGGDDAQFRIDSGERMRTLYETTFGESYPAPAIASWQSAPAPMDYRTGFVQLAGGTLTAWCAGPAARQAAGAGMSAWCAGPAARHGAGARTDAGTTAWCAGPAARQAAEQATRQAARQAANAATAWCAGPAAKPAANAAATAWCAGPAIRPAAHGVQLAA